MYFYKAVRIFVSIIFRIIFRIRIQGKDNIPRGGRFILCSNHISILDPIILAIAIPRPVHFMAKKELFNNRFLGKLISMLGAFPVDRSGSDLSAIRSSLRVLKDEGILGMFPEGTRVKEFNMDTVKPGIGMIAIKGNSPVIPVYIDSKYNILGRVDIKIGKLICFDEYYDQRLSTKDYGEISKNIMQSIYLLRDI
ncbi:MAG: 1-acyl-sn-glycerol-3-phosphate acyltransferase [Tissierellia bacterium]|nr:1-acyl-sn-glycerol-3-phosphate acyltransferase [Tissierellia bacterium]